MSNIVDNTSDSDGNGGGSRNSEAVVYQASENPGMALVSVLLTENNYVTWSRAMKMALGAKEKLSFIDGRTNPPDVLDTGYDKWKRLDYMVCSWLINSISANLREQFMFTDNASTLWEELYQRYGMSNGPMLYQIRRELSAISQGTMSVVAYFSKLKRCWDELAVLEPLPECKCNVGCVCTASVEYMRKAEKHKLMDFLLGLSSVFDGVKDQILVMEPWPTINKAYSMVMSVEKKSQLAGSFLESTGGNSVMMTKTYPDKRRFVDKGKKPWEDKRNTKCVHCGAKGHTKDSCFKLIGYPDWWNDRNKGREGQITRNAAYLVDTPFDSSDNGGQDIDYMVQTMAQMQKDLDKLMKTSGGQNSSSTGQVNMVHLDNFAGPTL